MSQLAFVHSPDSAYVYDADLGNPSSTRIYVAQLERSEILCFDETAALIWDLLQQPRTVDTLIDLAADMFEVPPETVSADITVFVSSLLDLQLIRQVLP